MVEDRLCHDYNDTALSIGHTPKLDDRGRVVPIGPSDNPDIPDERARFYVMGIANAMVSGFSSSSHKLYKGLWKARAAWAAGPHLTGAPHWIPPKPRPPIATPGLPPLLPAPAEPNDADDFQLPSDFDAMPPAPTINIPVPQEEYVKIYNPEGENLTPLPVMPHPSSPLPSIASIGSALAHSSSPSWMSSGTISVRSLDTALELSASMTNLSMGERYTAVDSVVQEYIARLADGSIRPSPDLPSASSSLGLRHHQGAPAASSSVRGPEDSPGINPQALTCNRAAGRRKGDPVYVVVRGARPGVYLDHDTALCVGGRAPGLKIVRFYSLKYACFQFVVEYMNGEVGVPRFVVAPCRQA